MDLTSEIRPQRARLRRLLHALGGPDPVASALAECEVRAFGPAVLPDIDAILACAPTGLDDVVRSAAKGIVGSGIVASAFEAVRRNPRYWVPAGAVLLGAVLLVFAVALRTAAADRRLRRGAALAIRALDDLRGAPVLLEMARRGQLNDEAAETLAGLMARSRPSDFPAQSLPEAGLAAALRYPHHGLRMACLYFLSANPDARLADTVRELARMRAATADEVEEREEARRLYFTLTGKEP